MRKINTKRNEVWPQTWHTRVDERKHVDELDELDEAKFVLSIVIVLVVFFFFGVFFFAR